MANTKPENLKYERSKTPFRWVVLILSCWAMFGSYYCYDNPTALNSQFTDSDGEYHLSSLKYNLLYSVYSFPNVILPLFGGVFVDKFGAGVCLVFFLSLCVIGQALFALACSLNWYWLMLVGRTFYGFGGESLCVAESALLGVYFKGKEMALAMGLNLSLARGGSSLNDVVSLYLAKKFSVSIAVWGGFLLLLICLAFTCLMVILDRKKCNEKKKEGYIVEEASSGERFRLSDIYDFDVCYWLLTISCLVVYGCVLPWNNIGGAFIENHYSYSDGKANSRLLIPYTISAILTPFLGAVVDRFGHRSEFLLLSACALASTHYLFAFTYENPLIALVILGLAYSIYASAIWPSVALVVKETKLGTAYGLITSVQNGGLALFPLIVGQLTRSDSAGTQKYKYVEIFFLGLAAGGIITGIVLIFVDYKKGARLSKSSRKTAADDNNNNIIACDVDDNNVNNSLAGPSINTNYTRLGDDDDDGADPNLMSLHSQQQKQINNV